MMQRKWICVGCLGIALTVAGSIAWSAPQGERKPPYTPAEYNAYYAAASSNLNHQKKLELLDAFIVQYPDSVLVTCAYLEYSNAYFFLERFSESVEYADKALAHIDDISPGMCGRKDVFYHAEKLQGLLGRAQAYVRGCYVSAFHTPEADANAKDSAREGQQAFSEFQVPQNVGAPPSFKRYALHMFDSVVAIADSDLNGNTPADSCKAAGIPDHSKFNDMIGHINSQGR